MYRTSLAALGLLFLSASGLCQSTSGESDGMVDLVAEVRLLRKDLQTVNEYALKAQILFHRQAVQEARVGRISQHVDELRSGIAELQKRERDLTAMVKRFEKSASDNETSPTERKRAETEISAIKVEIEGVIAQEQEMQTAKLEAEEQLRTEQAKLGSLEEQLDRLDKDLEKVH